jgi:EAL domain-containing protein (putative c-di-GMP-specific phosphodiesterase class I)
MVDHDVKCQMCGDGVVFPVDFTMAFQPIIDLGNGRIWGYEALVRGLGGEPANTIFSQVTGDLLYQFDQACRVRAIELASKLFPTDASMRLSINFMPKSVLEPNVCIRPSLIAAEKAGFRHDQIVFEFTETEQFNDIGHVKAIVENYKALGFLTALDDFGAGYAGLNLLAEFQTDLIKIDMGLIRHIDQDPVRQAITAGILSIANTLDIEVIAEGVETERELIALRAVGVTLFQGYYFAKPKIETLPAVFELDRLDLQTRGQAAIPP